MLRLFVIDFAVLSISFFDLNAPFNSIIILIVSLLMYIVVFLADLFLY
jgi:hypothetical protein